MLALGAALGVVAALASPAADLPRLTETPELVAEVAAGRLPPIERRIPQTPLLVEFSGGAVPGAPGGELQSLVGSARDTRLMVVWGYARLIGYQTDLSLKPDLAERIDVEDSNRVFTIHLRPGHRWSDGHPFTAEDFRYFWKDIAHNKELSPTGLPGQFLIQGHAPSFEVINETTVRFSWEVPNPVFLTELAGTTPLTIYAPAHYLRQFHVAYADSEALKQRVREVGVRNWAALHTRMDAPYRNDNPDMPTLGPWVLHTKPPAERFVFTRNPYYHRIDPKGQQLPYIDRVVLQSVDAKIVPVKTGAGESDLQARYLNFDNYTFLKQAAARNNYQVRLWITARGANLALYPNLTVADPVWRKTIRDVRFRRALSLGIDRHEINMVVFYGLATEGNNTALKESPLYEAEFQKAWARHDPDAANKLLDEMGLTLRDSAGFRLLSDGRPATIIIESPGDNADQTDALQLVRDSWRQIGIKLLVKTTQTSFFRNRVFSGQSVMSVFFGAENGLPTPTSSPAEWAPTAQWQLQWSQWGNHVETAGKAGEAIELPEARELLDLYHRWTQATSMDERKESWRRMLAINADQVFTIGLASAVPQPVIVRDTLRNVPEKAMYNWDPGALFGVYRPDQFWFDKAS
ncbi:MAG: ABC transporter substrate-binding protein [Proteobacteria bacterium]|nr:ABC transporter substrate-binding protein [Pseudomonadota bacterium]